MAQRDPNKPQLDFPDLIAELITQLRLTGQVGLLDFSDQVVPTFLIGSRGINFGGDLPSFTSAAVFQGALQSPAGNAIVFDTGALPAGTYDIVATVGVNGLLAAGTSTVSIEHRDAANAATLAILSQVLITVVHNVDHNILPLIGYVIGLNERIRCINGSSPMTNGGIRGTLFAQIRPTP
jgi:hypothetical protein